MKYGLAGENPKASGNKIPAGGKNQCMDNAKITADIPTDSPPSKTEGQSSGSVQHARSGSKNKVENMKNMPTKSGAGSFSGEGSSKIKYS